MCIYDFNLIIRKINSQSIFTLVLHLFVNIFLKKTSNAVMYKNKIETVSVDKHFLLFHRKAI